MIKGKRISAGLYEYTDSLSGLVWCVNFVDSWSVPAWTVFIESEFNNSFGDGQWDRKRDAVADTLDWIESRYNGLQGKTIREVKAISFHSYSDGFTKLIAKAVYNYMLSQDVQVFDLDVFKAYKNQE